MNAIKVDLSSAIFNVRGKTDWQVQVNSHYFPVKLTRSFEELW